MDENPKDKRSGIAPIGCTIIAGLLVATTLYVLSIGPAYRVRYVHRKISTKTFDTVYAPQIWLMNSGWQPLAGWLHSYMIWWAPRQHFGGYTGEPTLQNE